MGSERRTAGVHQAAGQAGQDGVHLSVPEPGATSLGAAEEAEVAGWFSDTTSSIARAVATAEAIARKSRV